MKSGKPVEITDEFDTSKAVISANGNTVVYVSDDVLYAYTGKKPVKIADLENSGYCRVAVSPDGKTVAFCDMEDDDIKTYAWKGGSKVIDLDSDILPQVVSNGGKMIYGTNRDGDLYYIKGLKEGADEKIDGTANIVAMSEDHNKIVYTSSGNTYCFDTSLNSDDAVRITKSIMTPVADYSYGGILYIENFKKFYGRRDGNLYEYFRKGKDYDDEKLLSDVNGLILSDDNKSFVYIDDGDVMKGTLANAKNGKKVGKDAISVAANDNLDAVFYVDDDRTLRYAGKDGKIASDVRKYIVTDGGVCVFYDDDKELYYSVKGGEKKKADLEDIESLTYRNGTVFAVSDGELYLSTNGKSFKKTGVDVD